jgi:hypothetical protein
MYATGIGLVITESTDMLNRKKRKEEPKLIITEEPITPAPGGVEEEPENEAKPTIFDRFKKWFGEDIQ